MVTTLVIVMWDIWSNTDVLLSLLLPLLLSPLLLLLLLLLPWFAIANSVKAQLHNYPIHDPQHFQIPQTLPRAVSSRARSFALYLSAEYWSWTPHITPLGKCCYWSSFVNTDQGVVWYLITTGAWDWSKRQVWLVGPSDQLIYISLYCHHGRYCISLGTFVYTCVTLLCF